jgi:hypothetical protein
MRLPKARITSLGQSLGSFCGKTVERLEERASDAGQAT